MNQELLAKLKSAQEKGIQKAVSAVKADDYAELSNSQKVLDIVVPWETGKLIWREERGVQIHTCATFLSYNNTIFKSRVASEIGDLALGASIDLYGFDIEVDGEGKPIFDITKDDKGQEVKAVRLITTDENGNDIEPKLLMSFRPQWGVDRTKQWFSRLRDQDMLNLVPNKGVPRKTADIVSDATGDDQGTTQRRDSIAWNLLPGLQLFMERPILNCRSELMALNLTMEEAVAMEGDDLPAPVLMAKFISNIPVATNAPSKRGQQTGIAGNLTQDSNKIVVVGIEGDAFAGSPDKT